MNESISDTIKELCISGLLTDGAHHKQWFFEEILGTLGLDLNKLRAELEADDYSWEEGIAP